MADVLENVERSSVQISSSANVEQPTLVDNVNTVQETPGVEMEQTANRTCVESDSSNVGATLQQAAERVANIESGSVEHRLRQSSDSGAIASDSQMATSSTLPSSADSPVRHSVRSRSVLGRLPSYAQPTVASLLRTSISTDPVSAKSSATQVCPRCRPRSVSPVLQKAKVHRGRWKTDHASSSGRPRHGTSSLTTSVIGTPAQLRSPRPHSATRHEAFSNVSTAGNSEVNSAATTPAMLNSPAKSYSKDKLSLCGSDSAKTQTRAFGNVLKSASLTTATASPGRGSSEVAKEKVRRSRDSSANRKSDSNETKPPAKPKSGVDENSPRSAKEENTSLTNSPAGGVVAVRNKPITSSMTKLNKAKKADDKSVQNDIKLPMSSGRSKTPVDSSIVDSKSIQNDVKLPSGRSKTPVDSARGSEGISHTVGGQRRRSTVDYEATSQSHHEGSKNKPPVVSDKAKTKSATTDVAADSEKSKTKGGVNITKSKTPDIDDGRLKSADDSVLKKLSVDEGKKKVKPDGEKPKPKSTHGAEVKQVLRSQTVDDLSSARSENKASKQTVRDGKLERSSIEKETKKNGFTASAESVKKEKVITKSLSVDIVEKSRGEKKEKDSKSAAGDRTPRGGGGADIGSRSTSTPKGDDDKARGSGADISTAAAAASGKQTSTTARRDASTDRASSNVRRDVSTDRAASSARRDVSTERAATDEDSAVDEYRAKLAEKRRLAREKAEREAAEQEAKLKQQQQEEEERQRREEEEERRREAEELRLAEELRQAEQQRLQQAVEEEEKRKKQEQERLEQERQQRQEAERLMKEEAARVELERLAKIKKDEEEKLERKKRLEMIMKRVKTDDSPTKTLAVKEDSPSASERSPPSENSPTTGAITPPSTDTAENGSQQPTAVPVPTETSAPAIADTAVHQFKSPRLQQLLGGKLGSGNSSNGGSPPSKPDAVAVANGDSAGDGKNGAVTSGVDGGSETVVKVGLTNPMDCNIMDINDGSAVDRVNGNEWDIRDPNQITLLTTPAPRLLQETN